MYSHKQSCAHLTSWALSTKSTFKTRHFHKFKWTLVRHQDLFWFGDICLTFMLSSHPSSSQNSDYSLDPDQRNIIWNSKQGFTIQSPTFFYIDMFSCKTRVNNVTYKSRSYLVHRPGLWCHKTSQSLCVCRRKYVCLFVFLLCFAVNKIYEVKLNVSEPVKALKGQRLVLNCTATAALNSRVNISWVYPGKVGTGLLCQTHRGEITVLTPSILGF